MLITRFFSISGNVFYISKSNSAIVPVFNPLPDIPILDSSNSAANKDNYDVKNMDKQGYIYLIEWKTLWEKEKLLAMSNFSSPIVFSKVECSSWVKMSNYGVKG